MTIFLSSIMKGYVESYAGLSKSCWRGIILSFIESTLIGVYYFFSLYFVNELHFNIALAGVILSFYGMGTIFGGLLGGKLSDAFSPSIVSIGSLFIQAATLLILVKVSSARWLMADFFIMGIASYSFITSNHLWSLSHCKKEETRLKAINLLGVASNLGLGLSAIIINALARFGFHSIFLFSSALLFLSAIYFSFLNNKNKTIQEIKPTDTTPTVITKPNQKIVWLVLGCVFLVGFIIFQSGTTYSIYIEKSFPELSLRGISILFSLNCFLVVFLQAPLVNFFRDYNKLLIVGIGVFLLGFGMLLLNFSYVFVLALLACVIYTVGEILFFSVAQFICYQKSTKENKGKSLGIYRTIYASSRVAAPAGGSFIYQQYGSRSEERRVG